MSRNEAILGAVALLLVVFSLVVSLVIPRRDPGFPGRNLKVFVVVAALLVVAMLAAVEVLGAEHEGGEGAEAAETDTGGGEESDTVAGEGEDPAEGDAAAGEGVFASAGCGSCHTLEEAGTSGTTGPSLDESSIDFAGAVQQIAQGGGGMPPFEGQLSEEEIQDVAAFVVTSQG
ncbi:MAG TPA: cytochrome c [Gaiellaceae bacterium]|nr:cytochrome c [Gaiellaceae bacterium]